MGELILCKTPVAARSYYIEEASLNIYSLEELSYYIYNNAFILNEEFISQAMIDWMEDQLGEDVLARDLLAFIESGAGVNVMIGHILRYTGYLTRDEIKRTLAVIASFEGKTEAEVLKIRSDHLMKNNRYMDAVLSYERIIDRKLPMEEGLKGDILHNLSCALCRLLLFKRASLGFESAYRLNRREDSLIMALSACLFDEDIKRFDQLTERYMVLPEVCSKIKDRYNNSFQTAENIEFKQYIDKRLSDADTFEKRVSLFSEVIEGYESDYIGLRS